LRTTTLLTHHRLQDHSSRSATAGQYHSLLGKRWTNVNKLDRRQYLLNTYRVLLTRARQGMVICVPEGDASDPTRDPHFYDPTFDCLGDIGIPVLQ
jgi:hypothetical protein